MTKGRETRARVLDSAIALFNRKGFGNTSIQDIIDATGVKKGNLYFHFASKDDLCLSLLREAGDRFFKYLSKSIKSPDPLGKIDDILHAVLNYHRPMRFSGGCISAIRPWRRAIRMRNMPHSYARSSRSGNRYSRVCSGRRERRASFHRRSRRIRWRVILSPLW